MKKQVFHTMVVVLQKNAVFNHIKLVISKFHFIHLSKNWFSGKLVCKINLFIFEIKLFCYIDKFLFTVLYNYLIIEFKYTRVHMILK